MPFAYSLFLRARGGKILRQEVKNTELMIDHLRKSVVMIGLISLERVSPFFLASLL